MARQASAWIETGPAQPTFPQLAEEVRADVAVIGGGIVGITTALLLQQAGASVVLLEANRLARGVSGHTTGKISSQHGMIYARLRSRFGAAAARTYAQANDTALEWIADRIRRGAIDC
ncbi:MAG TPA: FAD-binding oxidoreductase, partial [Solirubrobacteraceae bacterium]